MNNGTLSDITLRDVFAGLAMVGFCTDKDIIDTWRGIAKDAYAQADAMLQVRAEAALKQRRGGDDA